MRVGVYEGIPGLIGYPHRMEENDLAMTFLCRCAYLDYAGAPVLLTVGGLA